MPCSFALSHELFQRARRSIAGGINSGIRKLESPVPYYFVRGSGPNLWDADDDQELLKRINSAEGSFAWMRSATSRGAETWLLEFLWRLKIGVWDFLTRQSDSRHASVIRQV